MNELNKIEMNKSFLQKLNAIKEFVAIIVFFITGAVYFYGYIATKQEVKNIKIETDNSIKNLKCTLNHHVKFFRAQNNIDFLYSQLEKNIIEQAALEDMMENAKKLKQGTSKIRKKMSLTKNQETNFRDNKNIALNQRKEAADLINANSGCKE